MNNSSLTLQFIIDYLTLTDKKMIVKNCGFRYGRRAP
jgi:hypothetical protein